MPYRKDLSEAKEILIETLLPMSELVDMGIIYMINRDHMIPKGFLIALYITEDGHNSLGWTCIPVDLAKEIGVMPSDEEVLSREEAFDNFTC